MVITVLLHLQVRLLAHGITALEFRPGETRVMAANPRGFAAQELGRWLEDEAAHNFRAHRN